MTPAIAIIGGTGFYDFLTDATEVDLDTPFGKTSAPITVGAVGGKQVLFVPRHGRRHDFLPSEVPYRANLWALRELGATQVVGYSAVGSLQPTYTKGSFVLVDQFIDRTAARPDTIFGAGTIAHVSAADPYCARLRELVRDALAHGVGVVHPTGTVVVIQGPRFSSRAESAWFTAQGWHVVNMTQYPEVVLARELELCYMNVSYITDYDVAAREIVGDADADVVSHRAVVEESNRNADRMRQVMTRVVGALPTTADCSCRTALTTAQA